MSHVVEVVQDGHVRTIRLNRPEKMNAISEEPAWGVLGAAARLATPSYKSATLSSRAAEE